MSKVPACVHDFLCPLLEVNVEIEVKVHVFFVDFAFKNFICVFILLISVVVPEHWLQDFIRFEELLHSIGLFLPLTVIFYLFISEEELSDLEFVDFAQVLFQLVCIFAVLTVDKRCDLVADLSRSFA